MNLVHIIIILLILIIYRMIIKKRRKYFLVMVAIFKNENDYIEEWLKFHIKQGIDHFYLYDNNDESHDKETMRILNKYSNKITYIVWNNVETTKLYTTQRRAYQNCINKYNKEFKWIALADIDEFLYSTESSIKQIIKSYTNENTPFIKVPRYNFGDSGHQTKPDNGVVNNYIYREKKFSSYKSISNIDYIDLHKHTFGVHRYLYTTHNNAINTGIKIGNKQVINSDIPLVMNHYYTKSKKEYTNRCNMWSNSQINSIGFRDDCFDEEHYKNVNKNEIKDTAAKKLIN